MTALKMECVKMLALAYKRTISFYYYVPLLTSPYSTEVEKVERHVEEVKFVYSEKATKFWEISTLLLSTVHTDKSKVEILENFVAFSEYINFRILAR